MNFAPFVGIALWALIPGFIAKAKGRSFWGFYFLSFVITPLITMIITICLSNRNRAEESDRVMAPPEQGTSADGEAALNAFGVPPKDIALVDDTRKDGSPVLPPRIRFCRRCGFELIDGSSFCSRCGTEIEKESRQ